VDGAEGAGDALADDAGLGVTRMARSDVGAGREPAAFAAGAWCGKDSSHARRPVNTRRTVSLAANSKRPSACSCTWPRRGAR